MRSRFSWDNEGLFGSHLILVPDEVYWVYAVNMGPKYADCPVLLRAWETWGETTTRRKSPKDREESAYLVVLDPKDPRYVGGSRVIPSVWGICGDMGTAGLQGWLLDRGMLWDGSLR